MPAELVPQEYSERIEMIAGYPVAITSYRLGVTYYAKATIALLGMGARIAVAGAPTKEAAEEEVRAEARSRIESKGHVGHGTLRTGSKSPSLAFGAGR